MGWNKVFKNIFNHREISNKFILQPMQSLVAFIIIKTKSKEAFMVDVMYS